MKERRGTSEVGSGERLLVKGAEVRQRMRAVASGKIRAERNALAHSCTNAV